MTVIPMSLPSKLMLQPWTEHDTPGFHPLSPYVEFCYLPVLGPTATWLYRRLGGMVACNGQIEVDLADLATSMGLGRSIGPNSKLARSLGRLVHHNVARWDAIEMMSVRTELPPLSPLRVRRLPFTERVCHEYAVERLAEQSRRPVASQSVESWNGYL
jgi:hypothetical protein